MYEKLYRMLNAKGGNHSKVSRVEPLNPSALRMAGDAARDQSRWPAAAFFYKQLLKCEPSDAMLWLQHGHMLKECGLLQNALNSYQSAFALQQTNPEIQVQLAIISKLLGRFADASKFFAQAMLLDYPQNDFITTELEFIKATNAIRTRTPRSSSTDTRIFLSCVARLPIEADVTSLKNFLGATHYSYAYAMMGFRDALEEAGHRCEIITNPEYIPDITERSPARRHIHLGFYPPDGARYLKGAFNIMCVAWEFERLKTSEETLSYHAFADAFAMLARSQELWLTSSYGVEAFRRSGLSAVHKVSTPVKVSRVSGRSRRLMTEEVEDIATRLDRLRWVPLAIWPAMQSTLSHQALSRSRALLDLTLDTPSQESPVFFVSVFNVHDFRKQIKPLLHAFSRLSQERKDCFLLLKINCIDGDNTNINEILFAAQVRDDGEITTPLISDRILLTTESLSREEMNLLYRLSSYYVCTSYAEGQNLPLLEAMADGIVPVSVNNTAMADYITPENGIVIKSTYAPFSTRLTQRYGMYGLKTYHVESRDVLDALKQAVSLSDEQYFKYSDGAVRTVSSEYGVEPILAALERVASASAEDDLRDVGE